MRTLLLLTLAGTANADPVDLHEWSAAHGGAVPSSVNTDLAPSCDDTQVGPQHEPAMVCYTAEFPTFQLPNTGEPASRVLERYTLYVVRDQMLVTLLDAPTRAGMIDAPMVFPREQRNRFTIATDGMSIAVGDSRDHLDCSHKKPKLDQFTAIDREWLMLDFNLNTQICNVRGTYVWKRGQFVRKA